MRHEGAGVLIAEDEAALAGRRAGAFARAAFAYFGASSRVIALFAEHLRPPLRLLGVGRL